MIDNMKYIKKVTLINFQSHKYSEIEFDQYLNVIVGPSDNGKSSIIRGLKWALFNEPSGDFFIRKGETECSVTVLFSDGTKVKRYRSKNKNAYYLYDNNGEETVFEGFGTTVPEEIIDKTSMRKVILDSSQSNIINIADQLEGPFLLSEKNSTRANSIGRLVGVHIVDDALKDALKDIRNLNIKKKNHENNLEQFEKEIIQYDYLNNLTEKIKQVETIKDKIFEKQFILNKLNIAYMDIENLNKKIKTTRIYLKKLDSLYSVIEIKNKLNFKINSYNFINAKYKKLNQINKQMKQDEVLIYELKEIKKAEIIINDIKKYSKKVTKLNEISIYYKNVRNNILNNENIVFKLKNIDDIKSELNLIENKNLNLLELIKLKNKLNSINKSLFIGTAYIEKLLNLDSIYHKYILLEEKNNLLMKLINYNEKYNIIKVEKNNMEQTLKEINANINNQLDQYKLILTKIEVCPLCFSNINGLKINEIVSNLL